MAEIKRCKPQIMIVEAPDDDPPLPIEALDILRECRWKMRVIRLSLHDNELWLYQHERRNIENSDDLINVLQASWNTQGNW